jgi:ABC-2 type transport system permease protein
VRVTAGESIASPAATSRTARAISAAVAILGYFVHPVGQWLDTTTTFDWVSNGEWSEHAAKIAASVAVWIVLPLAAGAVRTLRRDVT